MIGGRRELGDKRIMREVWDGCEEEDNKMEEEYKKVWV